MIMDNMYKWKGKVAKINFDTKMIQFVKIKLNLNNIIDIYIINT